MGNNGNGRYHDSLVDYREPWEILDGRPYSEDALRSAHVAAVALINSFASSLESVLSRKDCTVHDIKVRFYGIAGALGLNLMDGQSFSQIADELGCCRASLSKIATEFCTANDLEPSFMMKAAGTISSYQTARIDSIRRSNGEAKLPVPPPHRAEKCDRE